MKVSVIACLCLAFVACVAADRLAGRALLKEASTYGKGWAGTKGDGQAYIHGQSHVTKGTAGYSASAKAASSEKLYRFALKTLKQHKPQGYSKDEYSRTLARTFGLAAAEAFASAAATLYSDSTGNSVCVKVFASAEEAARLPVKALAKAFIDLCYYYKIEVYYLEVEQIVVLLAKAYADAGLTSCVWGPGYVHAKQQTLSRALIAGFTKAFAGLYGHIGYYYKKPHVHKEVDGGFVPKKDHVYTGTHTKIYQKSDPHGKTHTDTFGHGHAKTAAYKAPTKVRHHHFTKPKFHGW